MNLMMGLQLVVHEMPTKVAHLYVAFKDGKHTHGTSYATSLQHGQLWDGDYHKHILWYWPLLYDVGKKLHLSVSNPGNYDHTLLTNHVFIITHFSCSKLSYSSNIL